MNIASIDHIVLTIKDIDATLKFYQSILGMHPGTLVTAG